MARPELAGPTKQRELPTQEARDLLALTRELALDELAPRAAADERQGRFHRDVLRTLGQAGLLGLPYAQEYGGGGQPYVVYLQVVEELATAWRSTRGFGSDRGCTPYRGMR